MSDKIKKIAAPLCVILVIAACIIWIAVQNSCKSTGSIAEVRVSNKVVLRLGLDNNTRKEIEGENGIRLSVVVENGSVYVEHSDCPDKICVNKGKISDAGDTIVCLPARTVVEVVRE